MASLSNINGIFDVHSTGAIQFNGNHGTAGQILKSNGNAAPTWVAASTVIGGPYLPLTGGTLTGATATASGISFTVGGTLSGSTANFSGNVTGPRFIGTSDRTEAVDSNDTRSTNPDPEDIGKGVYFDFKSNSTNGLSDGGGYNGMMLWRSYGGGSDLSGGQPIRLSYTANGNLWRQMGTGATSWGTWNKFAIGTGTTAQYIRGDASLATFPTIPPDPTGVYLPLAGGTMSGTIVMGSSAITDIGSISTNIYKNQAGSLLFQQGVTTGTARSLNLRTTNVTSDPSSVDISDSTGITWGQRTDSNPYYIIYPNRENFNSSGNYSKLTIAWHTGVRIGANDAYGGTRFYDDSPDISGASVIMNVGVGNTNVGVVNSLTVGGSVTWSGGGSSESNAAYDNYASKTYNDAARGHLGGYYTSGGTEKPNASIFGAGKARIAMLGSGNLGFGGPWNDVFWMSAYNGGDVKRSTAIVSSKYDNTSVWVVKQNYDSSSWGTGYLFWNSGNFTPGNYLPLSGGTVTGVLGLTGIANLGNIAPSRILMSDSTDVKYCDLPTSRAQFNLAYSSFRRYDYTSDTNYSTNILGWGTMNLNSTIPGLGSGFWDQWGAAGNNGQPSSETSHWQGSQAYHYTRRSDLNNLYGYQTAVGAGDPALMYVRGIWSGSSWGPWYRMHNDKTALIKINNQVSISTYNDRNLKIQGASSSDAGITGYAGNGGHLWQLYGSGNDYGFLNSNWGSWDLRKTKNGNLYMNNNNTYYLSTNGTSVLNALQFNYTQHGSANNIRMGNSTTMNAISSGTNNAAFGVEALGNCSSGSRNFAYGYAALFSVSSGGSNIAMGDATGYNVTSGSNNLLFGQNAGRTGYQSPYQSIAGVTSGSNQIHMGNESHSTARIQISWTVNSDERDKTDITPINVGLDFVKQLNPVTYRWDKRSSYEDRTPTGENKLEELTLGFLAQEVEEVEKSYGYDVANKTNLVVDRDIEQDHYGITYEKMIPILTKAIQELEARVKELENK